MGERGGGLERESRGPLEGRQQSCSDGVARSRLGREGGRERALVLLCRCSVRVFRMMNQIGLA